MTAPGPYIVTVKPTERLRFIRRPGYFFWQPTIDGRSDEEYQAAGYEILHAVPEAELARVRAAGEQLAEDVRLALRAGWGQPGARTDEGRQVARAFDAILQTALASFRSTEEASP